jgi:predicted alpha/beta hydrolase family esterase
VPSSRRFLILHGWQNRRPQAHWEWQLADPDHPRLDDWTGLLHAELAQLGAGERVVIAHSLAVPLWLHAAGTLTAGERVARALLVAPPSPDVLGAHQEVAEFGHIRPDRGAVAAAARSTRLVFSDDDPYCPEGAGAVYGSLGLDSDVIAGGGHLDPHAGYGAWPAVLGWCRDPGTRLRGR